MRNSSSRASIIPRSNAFANRSDLIWLPMIGGESGSIGVSNLTIGNPTKILLGASHTAVIGQYVYLSGLGGTTQLNGNFYKIVGKESDVIYLDVDSGSYPAHTSGGSVNFDVIYDRCGNLAPQLIQGTTTNAWDNPSDGFTSHSAGNHSPVISALPEMLNFVNAKYCVVGATVKTGATPSAFESIISIGQRTTNEGNNGHIGLAISSSGTNIEFLTRPATSTTGTNTFSYSTNIGLSTSAKVVGFIDFSTGVQYVYLNGSIKDTDSINLNNAISNPNGGSRMCIGANYDNTFTPSNKFGGAATPSQGRVKDLFIWRPDNSLTQAQVHSAIAKYHRQGEWLIQG